MLLSRRSRAPSAAWHSSTIQIRMQCRRPYSLREIPRSYILLQHPVRSR
ncbi:hypothetical protein PVAP13_6KG053545 [Panicum virgatum]|uniref:Uncharacterized protein n=1 Tax=Panicum virgatum TaxID=38727 RepID=A0A8T0RAZ2_PANVG|nr:hypothetical protein PVAP13_6KG053545 [Panicum virgatum]